MMRHTLSVLTLASLLAGGEPDDSRAPQAARIPWIGVWTTGLAEARRTGRPILLTSAAPHCRNISGMW